MTEESYPAELRYHPEHDWARIEGDEAVLGITWHAQDALGELVHYEPPEPGQSIAKDQSYGEVESVKAVSDLVSPLSGEVLEVNQEVVDAPELVNDDPYGRGLARADPARRSRRGRRPARRRRLPRAARRRLMARGLDEPGTHPYLSLTDADRREMLAAIGVETVEELFRDIPAGVRFGGQLDLEPALSELELVARAGSARRAERRGGRRALVPRRRDLRPPRARRRRRGARPRRAAHRVHALPAGDEPGRAPGDLRVPDRDLRAHGHGGLERLRLRRDARWRRTPATWRSTRPAARRSSSPRRCSPQVRAVVVDLRGRVRHGGGDGAAPRRHDRSGRAAARRRREPRSSSSSSRASFGCLEPAPELAAAAEAAGALACAHVDPLSLGVLEAPGAYGCAIAIGEGQPAGNHLVLRRARTTGSSPRARR